MRKSTFVLILLLSAVLALVSVSACAEGEFRPLPIDLTGGAPYAMEYASDLLVYEDPTIRVERSLRTHSDLINREYYTVDVIIKDASQLRTASAEPTTFITERRVLASTIAKRVNAVFAMNGDYCGVR